MLHLKYRLLYIWFSAKSPAILFLYLVHFNSTQVSLSHKYH